MSNLNSICNLRCALQPNTVTGSRVDHGCLWVATVLPATPGKRDTWGRLWASCFFPCFEMEVILMPPHPLQLLCKQTEMMYVQVDYRGSAAVRGVHPLFPGCFCH